MSGTDRPSAGAIGGAPLHIDAAIDLATVGGTWRDNTGAPGNFVLVAGPGAADSPRPAPIPTFVAGLRAGHVFSTSTRVRVSGDLPEANSGVRGESLQGVGVYGRGDVSNSYSFYNEGGYFEGGKGLYARGTDPFGEQGYGARIYSANYRGVYVQGASTRGAASGQPGDVCPRLIQRLSRRRRRPRRSWTAPRRSAR